MKRYISTAVLFLSFVLALCNAGHAALERIATTDSRIEQAGHYAAHYFSHPNTELEIYQNTNSGNSTCRFPSTWGFITHTGYTGILLLQRPCGHQDQPTGHFCKKYLSHLYPSHNFW